MGFFEKARTFFEASGMAKVDFLAVDGASADAASVALTDTALRGRYRVTAQRDCVVLRHVVRVCSRLPERDGSLGTVLAEAIHDAGHPGSAAPQGFPYALAAGQTVEDDFTVEGVDLPASLAGYEVGRDDPRVEFFLRVTVDVQGSPFDPEFELRLTLR